MNLFVDTVLPVLFWAALAAALLWFSGFGRRGPLELPRVRASRGAVLVRIELEFSYVVGEGVPLNPEPIHRTVHLATWASFVTQSASAGSALLALVPAAEVALRRAMFPLDHPDDAGTCVSVSRMTVELVDRAPSLARLASPTVDSLLLLDADGRVSWPEPTSASATTPAG